jgi:DNA-binding transcriptional ArsR family regulator
MQEPNLTSLEETSFEILPSLEITNPEAAAFLADATKVKHIRPFFAKECSLAEAAKMLKLPLANMHYWVSKMEELGLIKQTKVVKRKGSPVKYYRTVADEFTVPLEHIPVASVEELLGQRQKPWLKRTYKALTASAFKYTDGWQAHFYQEGSNMMYSIVPKRGNLEDAQIFYLWMLFRLTPEQAKNFRAELLELQTRYLKLHEENGDDVSKYITHLLSVQDG